MLAEGTLVKTPEGLVRVEELEKGDVVESIDHNFDYEKRDIVVTSIETTERTGVVHTVFKGDTNNHFITSVDTWFLDEKGNPVDVCEVPEGTTLFSDDKKTKIDLISYVPNIHKATTLYTICTNQPNYLLCTERGVAVK